MMITTEIKTDRFKRLFRMGLSKQEIKDMMQLGERSYFYYKSRANLTTDDEIAHLVSKKSKGASK